ncbi:hypothetical protein [Desertivirga arenae]|uniref:hypothetical protein n=1 Tax=Desertivirga arenae TaxID=2810309 RepID=UPI001A960217|nr:hypothetical protein [Pedobacter sp. SYSU D00823]
MDKQVENAIAASLKQFNGDASTEFKNIITGVFEGDNDFMSKVEALDNAFDDAPQFDPLREVFFDLLMVNFFAEDVDKLEEDYLESKEWEEIEEETIDRGSELLNVLLYIRECKDEDIKPELEDFLKEFLLVDEDEFQDEYRIYEDIIAHQILMESNYSEIGRVAKNLDDSSEIKDFFYPIMGFFYQNNPSEEDMSEYLKHSEDPEFDGAVYKLVVGFNQ